MSIIQGIETRLYQEMLFMDAKDQNSLIVLPTGLGKTIIILYLTAHFYKFNPEKKILIATPTRPLVNQIANTLRQYLNIDNPEVIIEVAGSISPIKRQKLYQTGKIFIGTPQTFSNDFDTDKLDPKDFSLLCFDEAHRSTGNYAYVKIVQNFADFNLNPRIIGFTATPGNKPEQIENVINNLHIQMVCSRFPDDIDVKPYISNHKPKIVWVELPDLYKNVNKFFEEYEKEIIYEVNRKGLETPKYITKRVALDLQKQVTELMHDDPEIAELLYYVPNLTRILHIKEIVETQGLPLASITLEKWFHEPKKKTLKMFVEHPFIKSAFDLISKYPDTHPKLQKLINILKERSNSGESKIIVFSNFRDTVDYLVTEIEKIHLTAKKFVGQSSQKGSAGMSQKDQLAVLEEFKNGDLNILISTSVGEEGIDVGACDLVIFYDSVSSVIRSVQRTGRGRKKESEVIRLVTKNTKDSAMYYAMLRQEKKIQNFIRHELPKKLNVKVKFPPNDRTPSVKQKLSSSKEPEPQLGLDKFLNKSVNNKLSSNNQKDTIIGSGIIKDQKKEDNSNKEIHSEFQPKNDSLLILVDNREARSQVPRLLKKSPDTKIQLVNLPEGDYRVSEDCVIERKTMHDLAESIIDGRLFDQVGNKLTTYKKPIIIIEGNDRDIKVNLNPKAIKGALATILLSFKIPILHTINEQETTDMIIALAKREQKSNKYNPNFHTISKKYPIKEIQRFILSSIPGVNRAKADEIIKEFKTIKNLTNAEYEDVIALPGIGKTLTNRILKILQEEASDSDHID